MHLSGPVNATFKNFTSQGNEMSVLVTGGAGYIGGHAVLALLDRGEKPVILDNLSTGHHCTVPPGVPFFLGDVGDLDLVEQIIRTQKVDAILHFAAKVVVSESVGDPLGYYLNNTVKTRSLLENSVRLGIKHFVFSSTAAVYGNAADTPVSENSPLAPLSPYGMSKLMSEQMLRHASEAHDLNYVILRYFNVAGADPAGRLGQLTKEATHLVKVSIETALGRRPFISIFGDDYPTRDGTCIRDYIHVSDLANAHLLALDYLRQKGKSRILNCGYGRGYSVKEVINTVAKVSGVSIEVKQVSRRAGDPASIIANSDELKRLGWKPLLNDLPTIVKHAYLWEKRTLLQSTRPDAVR
jgi:UDP-glucose 4-epimerase